MKEYLGYFLLTVSGIILYSGVSPKARRINFRYILCLSPLFYAVPSSIPKDAFEFDLSWGEKIDKKNCFNTKEKAVILAIISSICTAFYQKREKIFTFILKSAFMIPLILMALFLLYDQIEDQKTKKWI